jgi:hypothetical protein
MVRPIYLPCCSGMLRVRFNCPGVCAKTSDSGLRIPDDVTAAGFNCLNATSLMGVRRADAAADQDYTKSTPKKRLRQNSQGGWF